MGRMKALFHEIQEALDKKDKLTLQYILHHYSTDDGDRSWIVEQVLATVGQWLYNDPRDGWDAVAYTLRQLEGRREGLEIAFLMRGVWLGEGSKFICHSCAHLLSEVLGVPLDEEEPECDCGRHEAQLSLESVDPRDLPCAVEPLRCPCNSLLAVRMFEDDLTRAVKDEELSETGARWYRELNESLNFSGFLATTTTGNSEEETEESE